MVMVSGYANVIHKTHPVCIDYFVVMVMVFVLKKAINPMFILSSSPSHAINWCFTISGFLIFSSVFVSCEFFFIVIYFNITHFFIADSF